MTLTNEDLLAISQLLDTKIKSIVQSELQPIKDDIRDIKLHIKNVTDKNIQLLAETKIMYRLRKDMKKIRYRLTRCKPILKL